MLIETFYKSDLIWFLKIVNNKRIIMRKLIIAAFMFVSSFGSNVMADGHAIKMGIILGFTGLSNL